jgi:TPR repeat protein
MNPATLPPLPSNLKDTLAHPMTPWNISPELFQRIRSGEKEKILAAAPNTPPEKKPYKTSEVLPTDSEYQFILKYFMHQKPANYSIKKAYCIHNPTHTAAFEAEVKNIDEEIENPVFKPKWREEDLPELREKTIARWKSLASQFAPVEVACPTANPPRVDEFLRPKVIPFWHGSSKKVYESICRSNFTFFGKHHFFDSAAPLGANASVDIGYFGSGIYFTNSAQYAAMYSPQGILILAWVAMREPYPVVSDIPYPSKCADMKKLQGKGAYQNYNAHYTPVVSVDPANSQCMEYYPCLAGQEPAWDELVVFKNSQTLPRFWVELCVDMTLPVALISDSQEKQVKMETDKQRFEGYKVGAKKKDPEAFYQLGMCYLKGIGCAPVPKEAIKMLQKAARLKHAKAALELGHCYAKGLAVPKDAKEAFRWFLKAAELKLADAEFEVALCYASGTGTRKDDKEALAWYKKAAEQGHEVARIQVANLEPKPVSPAKPAKKDPAEHFKLAEQKASQKDYNEAFVEYQLAAEQGHAEAQCKLGVCYFRGQGVTKDEAAAVKWYQKAADQNFPLANYFLGASYFHGKGVATDLAKGVELQRKAAEQGIVPAQYYLGTYYLNGVGVPKDLQEALKWFQKAAEQGDLDAKKQVGALISLGVSAGESVDHFKIAEQKAAQKDFAAAAKEYRLAADQGHAEAQCKLGACYFRGNGVEKNEKEAVKWYQKAADQGFALAEYYLGSALFHGRGIEKNVVKGIELHRQAAEKGIVPAQYYLGTFYEKGEGVKKDEQEALKWFEKAAALGDADAKKHAEKLRASSAPAMPPIPSAAIGANLTQSMKMNADEYFKLGEQEATQNNHVASAVWYQKAAEAGHAEAQCKYGACYFRGLGVAKNEREAIQWYQKSADQGFAQAQYYLGSALFHGRGVDKDIRRGIELHLKAAEQGIKAAQYYLGTFYLNGEGVTKDVKEALKWFEKAAAQGDADALAYVEKLKASMVA